MLHPLHAFHLAYTLLSLQSLKSRLPSPSALLLILDEQPRERLFKFKPGRSICADPTV